MPLGSGIHRGGRLVQHQYGGLGDCCSGDIQQLSLPLGQVCAVAREHGLIAVLQTHNEGVRRGGLCRGDHLFVGGVGSAVADIFHHGTRKQVGILQDHCDVLSKHLSLDLLDVHAVDSDTALFDIVEAV